PAAPPAGLNIDDYPHHPGEIRATLRAARARYPGRSIWAVFQPHTYSRTRALLEEFARAFEDADHVILTPIYAARETDSLGVSSQDIVARMVHPDARYLPDFETVVAYLCNRVRPGDVVLTLGAGDGYRIGEQLLERLRQLEEGG
ncbi:MAG: glutamate ligase domain-containing protein, partial [Thermoflexus sp.]